MGFIGSSNRVFPLVACASILAAGTSEPAWQKVFTEWTTKDAQQIMTDSPWAKQMPMPAAARPGIAVLEPGANGGAPPSSALGNPSNTTVGTNMTVAGSPGSQGPAEPAGLHTTMPQTQSPAAITPNAPAPEPAGAISIVWASATPVRLAVLKLQSGVNTPTQGEIERVSKPRDNYVIAVIGLAPPDSDINPATLAGKAFLIVKGKPMVSAGNCTYRKIGNADVYFFRFPRTGLPISDGDHQVEFKVTFGQAEIKHRFELKAMEYQGQLAL